MPLTNCERIAAAFTHVHDRACLADRTHTANTRRRRSDYWAAAEDSARPVIVSVETLLPFVKSIMRIAWLFVSAT